MPFNRPIPQGVTVDLPPIFGVDLPPFEIPGTGGFGGGCPPGTAWPGIPYQSNVCLPTGTGGVVPGGGGFNPSGSPECIWPWRRDPITGECKVFLGDVPGADPTGNGGTPPGQAGSRIHGEFFHTDQVPRQVSVTVRRCPRGHVLGKDRWCHPKGSIPNKERLYPKPPRPLGSVREMKCITVAGQFARRLKSKKKTLNKLATALASK